jgi:FMN-dependent NADH-azoreductase
VVPYLKAVFGFLGVTDVATVNVATNHGEEVLAQTQARASAEIAKFVGSAA